MKNENNSIPSFVKVLVAIFVVILTFISSFALSAALIGFEFDFDYLNPVSYLVILPGFIISLIASYLVPAADLKGALIQAVIWALPILFVQGGFQALLELKVYLIPCGMIAGAVLGFVLRRKVLKSRSVD